MRILLLLATVACTSGVGSEAQPIVGGYFDQSEGPTVALFRCSGACAFTPYLNATEICSGTLIGPNLVLTARHCVAPEMDPPTGLACSTSTFGTPYPADNFIVTPADSVFAGGPWTIAQAVAVTGQDGDGVCGNDVAALTLRSSIVGAVPLIPRITEAPIAGEKYSAIGYGDDGDGGLGYRHRRDELKVSCVGTACKILGPDLTPLVAASEFMGETGLCGGDSGGPAVDASGLLFGVTSRGSEPGCVYPTYSRVDAHAAWLQAQAVAAAQAGGYEIPAWAYAPLPSDGGTEASVPDASGVASFDASRSDAASVVAAQASGGCGVGGTTRDTSSACTLFIVLVILAKRRGQGFGRRTSKHPAPPAPPSVPPTAAPVGQRASTAGGVAPLPFVVVPPGA